MKKLALLLLFVFLLQPLSAAQIPFGVSTTKVVIDGSVDLSDTGDWCYIDGLPGHYSEGGPFDGKWDFIEMDNMEYTLTFYNVGSEGERVGMLFWREEYKKATLTIRYNAATAGKIWKISGYLDEEQQQPVYSTEDAGTLPDFNEITYNLEFTGTPWGTFHEIAPFVNKAGKKLTAEITSIGEKVMFHVPATTMTELNANGGVDPNPPFVTLLNNEYPTVPGNPWYGWDLQGSGECGGDSGARFNELVGQVEVFPDDDWEDTRPAQWVEVIEICDHITTEDDSSAVIGFADWTTYHMKESSHIKIDSPPARQSKLSLVAGKILTNVRRMVKNGTMEVTMNQAVAGVKGTIFICEDDGTTSTVKVLHGTVEFTSLATGDVEMISAGETMSATIDGLSDKTAFDIQEELEQWDDYEFDPQEVEYVDWDPYETSEDSSSSQSESQTPGFEMMALLLACSLFIAQRKKKQKR